MREMMECGFRVELVLLRWHRRFFRFLKRMLQGSSFLWCWKLAFGATLFSLMVATPRVEVFTGDYEDLGDLSAKFRKMEHPLEFHSYEPGSHNAKVAFRLTGHMIAHFLHLDYRGHKAFEFIGGYFLFLYTALLTYRITGSRYNAAIATLYAAVIYAGSTAFIEFRMMYDGLAILLLIMALYHKHWFLTGPLLFLCAYTDERGLVASCLVFSYHFFDAIDRRGFWRALWWNASLVSIVVAWVCYFLTRLALIHEYGFQPDAGKTSLFFQQANNLAVGVWSGLEGGWLIVMLAAIGLACRERLKLVLLLPQIAIVVYVAMSVEDITRSMAYLFPVVFISLKILSKTESNGFLYRCLLAAFILSLIWPSAYFWGSELQWWHAPPFPIQFMNTCLRWN
jgi:hypothetical protein